MKIGKLYSRLSHYLGKGNQGGENDHQKTEQILNRLELRREQLRQRLASEKRVCKQKRMRIELKIVEVKLEKVKRRRAQMNPT
jgi:hypothetical protein